MAQRTETPAPRFTPDLFRFLGDLAANNEREWFKANKQKYDDVIKEPALEFIEAFGPRLEAISPHFEANARAVGGSLFRIHRDTRFSKDKTPYKLNTGVHFRHERAKDAHAPGFYLHLQPRSCFMGVGLWMPEPKVAHQIRAHIGENRDRWTAITAAPTFRDRFELSGDSLVRPPKGFDKDDPLLTDLKRKSFIALAPLTQGHITRKDFIDRFEADCRAGADFVQFLCAAVGVDF